MCLAFQSSLPTKHFLGTKKTQSLVTEPLQGYKQSPESNWGFSAKPTRPVVYPRNKIFCSGCCWNHKRINWHRHISGCVIKGAFTFILNSSRVYFLGWLTAPIYIRIVRLRDVLLEEKRFTLKDYTSVTLQSHESHTSLCTALPCVQCIHSAPLTQVWLLLLANLWTFFFRMKTIEKKVS